MDGFAAREIKAEPSAIEADPADGSADSTNTHHLRYGGLGNNAPGSKQDGQGVGLGLPRVPIGSEHESSVSASQGNSSATPQTLQEKRQHQLKLLNMKLAKRYSGLPPPRREGLVHADALPASTDPSVVVQRSIQQPLTAGEEWSTRGERGQSLGKPLDPGGNMTSSVQINPILSSKLPDESIATKGSPFPEHSPPPGTVQSASASNPTGAFSTIDPLPTSIDRATRPKGELLESESSFLPVFPADASHDSSSGGHHTTLGGQEDPDAYVNSLLYSLNSAYGYSSLAEKSRLLRSLVDTGGVCDTGGTDVEGILEGDDGSSVIKELSTPGASEDLAADFDKKVIKIQAAYRGFAARRRTKIHRSEVKAATLIQATWWAQIHNYLR